MRVLREETEYSIQQLYSLHPLPKHAEITPQFYIYSKEFDDIFLNEMW